MGDTNNAFDKDVTYLKEAYDKLTEIQHLQTVVNQAQTEEKRLKKTIAQKEKVQAEEVVTAVRKRKAEINAAYDKQISVLRGKIKQVDAHREAYKVKEQGKRFDYETRELREQIEECNVEIRNTIKQYHILRFCRSNWYYKLFMPKGIREYLVLFCVFIALLFALPALLCVIGNWTFLKAVSSKTIYYVLIFVCCVSLTFILYLLIANQTHRKYPEQLRHCREQKDRIYAVRRQMRAVHTTIRRDKDESEYGLDEFDEQIAAFQQEMTAIGEQLKEALKDFENTKKPIVEQEIAAMHEGELQQLSRQLLQVQNEQESAQKEIQELKLAVSNQYEAYLGKEYVNIARLEVLIDIMEEEGIATVGEAIASLNNSREA